MVLCAVLCLPEEAGWSGGLGHARATYLILCSPCLTNQCFIPCTQQQRATEASKAATESALAALWRWHVRRELLMQVHLAVISTDTLPGWPDVCPGGLINTARGRGQRRVWLDVGWERSAQMTGWLRPGLSQWRGRFAPALWGSPLPPLPQAAPQNPGTVLHGCDTSLCKPFSTAETCLLWPFWPLCTESRSQHAHFTCCQCSCFISGQVCSPWKNLSPACFIRPRRAQRPRRTQNI